jgi:tetratricopeptide (TPR) repeat protein
MEVTTAFLLYATLFRLAVIGAGIASIVLGYRLFVTGVSQDKPTAAEVKAGVVQFVLRNAAPGTVFALFGGVIISLMVTQGNPELVVEEIQQVGSQSDPGITRRTQLKGSADGVPEGLAAFKVLASFAAERRRQGDATGAVAAYARALAMPQVSLAEAAPVMSAIADLYLEQERGEEALPLARLAAGLNPDDPSSLDTLARVLLARGNTQEAVQMARRAVELSPKNADYRHTLALSLEKAGDPQSAVEAMEQAAQSDPRYRQALEALRQRVR